MKSSKLFYLAMAAAVLAVAAWYLHRGEKSSWQDRALPAGADLLAGIPVNDVAAVSLRGPDGAKVTLRRAENCWSVGERAGYPADFGKIVEFVRKLSGLKALQAVPVAQGDLGALALRMPGEGVSAEQAGTVVELRGADDAKIASVVLGKIHYTSAPGMRPEIGGAATGRYVMSEGGQPAAYLVTETFADLRTAPSAWIDTGFVRPGLARRLEVRAEGKDRSWTLERETPGAPWKLAGAKPDEPLAAAQLVSLDSLLSGMVVSDAPDGPDDARSKPLADKPVSVSVETFDGLRYVFTIGEGLGDNLPVKVAVQALAEAPVQPAPSPESGDAAKQAAENLKLRDDRIAGAARFQDRVVFIPRNFVEIFLKPRAALLAQPLQAPQPAPVPTPTTKPAKAGNKK